MSIDKKSTYYDVGGIEVMDVIEAKLTTEQFRGYLLGNCIKYSLRCNHKGTMDRDVEKLTNYSRLLNNTAQDGDSIVDDNSVPLSNMEAIRNDAKNGDR